MTSIFRYMEALPEDIVVMSAFIIGFFVWNRLKNSNPQSGKRNLKTCVAKSAQSVTDPLKKEVQPSQKQAEIAEPSDLVPMGPRRVVATPQEGDQAWVAIPEHHNTQFMEKKMIKLLENKSFRHALNLFRFVRRTVGVQEYTEELFLPFIQSAIRVGKMDVVEYMLKSMTEIPTLSAPSHHFWRTILKYLVSRKEYAACLSAHDLFGSKVPLENVVFRCLITAELEMGLPDHDRRVLKRLALGDGGHGPQQDPCSVFNNHLRLCVNEDQIDRAIQLLREAQALEKLDGAEKIVEMKSYSTVIRGFVRINNSSKCIEYFNEMLSYGFEPYEDTCRMVIDCCIKTGKMDAARKIEEQFSALTSRNGR
jgi:pentatricopeptide repeat protein